MNKTILVTKRLTLAPLNESDKSLFIQLCMDPEVMEHCYDPSTLEEAEAGFEAFAQPWDSNSHDWLCFGITETNSGDKVGNISIKILDHKARTAEVGFLLSPNKQGKGYAFEALEAVVKVHVIGVLVVGDRHLLVPLATCFSGSLLGAGAEEAGRKQSRNSKKGFSRPAASAPFL